MLDDDVLLYDDGDLITAVIAAVIVCPSMMQLLLDDGSNGFHIDIW